MSDRGSASQSKRESKWSPAHVSRITEVARETQRKSKSKRSLAPAGVQHQKREESGTHQEKMQLLWNRFTPKHKAVAIGRFAPRSEQRTLESVGHDLGLTRERVRQIQARIGQLIDDHLETESLEVLNELDIRCGEMVSDEEFFGLLTSLLGPISDPWDIVYQFYLTEKSQFRQVRGIWLAPSAQSFIELAKQYIPKTKEAHFVETSTLREIDPDFWYKYRALIIACLGLTPLPNGSIATRDTLPMRVLDALKYFGGPATKQELSELTGVSEKALLARLWCMEGVVKTANNMWTLKTQGATKYFGIVHRIEEILEEQGGEASAKLLREEISNRYNVKPSSVNTFLATSRFVVDNGRVRLRREDELNLRPLSQTIDGRLSNGAPYWTFTLQQRHLHGNSVTGFPPEMAHELKIRPNGYAWIPVSRPLRCHDVKVTWRLASANGVHVGYLGDVFDGVKCNVGQVLRLIVRHNRIEVQRHV